MHLGSLFQFNYFSLQEMQTQMKALNDKSNLPDMSEMLAGWLGGGSKKSGSKAGKRKS